MFTTHLQNQSNTQIYFKKGPRPQHTTKTHPQKEKQKDQFVFITPKVEAPVNARSFFPLHHITFLFPLCFQAQHVPLETSST
jgi:hypothetical protein